MLLNPQNPFSSWECIGWKCSCDRLYQRGDIRLRQALREPLRLGPELTLLLSCLTSRPELGVKGERNRLRLWFGYFRTAGKEDAISGQRSSGTRTQTSVPCLRSDRISIEPATNRTRLRMLNKPSPKDCASATKPIPSSLIVNEIICCSSLNRTELGDALLWVTMFPSASCAMRYRHSRTSSGSGALSSAPTHSISRLWTDMISRQSA